MAITSYNVYQQITSVRLSSVSNLSGAYFNGISNNGVGATLTALSVGALSVDGVSVHADDRILLTQQTNSNENGIYVVKNPGSAITLWKLQRSDDFQSLEQIKAGQYFSVNAGNTLGGTMYVLVEPLPSVIGIGDFVFVDSSSGGAGPYLTVAGNLSDMSNREAGFTNLGLGSGDELIIDESDFSGGLYILTNPCPNLIFVNAETTGNAIRLPPVDEPQSFIPSQGPTFFIQSGFEPVEIQDASGAAIATIEDPSCDQFVLTSNSDPDGIWFVRPFVSTVNGQSGDVTVAGVEEDLQEVYSNGDDASVELADGRPINFRTGVFSADINSVTTPSTGINTVANYRVLGFTFVPVSDMTITALQYDDALFTAGGSRETGIYVKSTEELLGSVFIEKTDPLDPTLTFRTKTLDNPIQVLAGIEYVFATVMAGGETNHLDPNAVTSNMALPETWTAPSSPFPIPLSFPQNIIADVNTVYVGSFVYTIFSVDEEVIFNDSTSSSSKIFEINSTSRASHPAPSMTSAQRLAIPSPSVGDIVNDTDNNAIYRYNGSSWMPLITNLTSFPYLVLTNSIGFPNTGLGTIPRYYYSIEFSVDGIISLPNVTNVNVVRRGYPIFLKNNSLFVATIGTSGGSNLFIMYPGDFYAIWNDTNTTADGTWIFENITGVMNYNNVTSTSAQMYPNNAYIADNAGLVTLTLPSVISQGDVVLVDGKGAGGWLIAQNAGQSIHLGSLTTTVGVGGSLASINRYDSIKLCCITDNTEFTTESVIGTITVV